MAGYSNDAVRIPETRSTRNTRTFNETTPQDHKDFAGIETKHKPGSAWAELNQPPCSSGHVHFSDCGDLCADSYYLDHARLQKLAAPTMKIMNGLLRFLYNGGYKAEALFVVHPNGTEISIHSRYVGTSAQVKEFRQFFIQCTDRSWVTKKLVEYLANLASEKFDEVWCDGESQFPTEWELLNFSLLRKAGTFFSDHKLTLVVDNEVLSLPSGIPFKTEKLVETPMELCGVLKDIASTTKRLVVEVHADGFPATLVTLDAKGRGFVEQINQDFRIGDAVKIVFKPKVQLLKPREAIPTKGVLVSIA